MIVKCVRCEKEFTIYKGLAREYAYRDKKGYYCSYSCKNSPDKPKIIEKEETKKSGE